MLVLGVPTPTSTAFARAVRSGLPDELVARVRTGRAGLPATEHECR